MILNLGLCTEEVVIFFSADESFIVYIHELYLNSRLREIDNASLTLSIY